MAEVRNGERGATSGREGAVRWSWQADGIFEMVLDDPGRKSNTVNRRYFDGMAAALDEAERNRDRIRGVVLRSAKRSFFSGDDVEPAEMSPEDAAAAYELGVPVKEQLRRLERIGRPVVAALTGSALGFGFEIGLAGHHRIGLDAPGVVYGFPEVTMGLLPGGGGVVRTTRMLGVVDAFVDVLSTGRMLPPLRALELGVIDELAPDPDAMLLAARAWIHANWAPGDQPFVQRWERVGYVVPGGAKGSAELDRTLPVAARWADDLVGGAPLAAPRTILDVAVESTAVDVDTAFEIEWTRQLDLLANPVTPRLGKLVFVDARSLRDGFARPEGPGERPRRVTVLGEGKTASSLRARAAQAGLVVLGARATDRGSTDVIFDVRPPRPAGGARPPRVGDGVSVLAVAAGGAGDPAQEVTVTVFGLEEESPVAEIAGGEEDVRRRAFDAVVALGLIPVMVRGAASSFVGRLRSAYLDEASALLAEGLDSSAVQRGARRAGFRSPAPVLGAAASESGSARPADTHRDPAAEAIAQRLLLTVALEAWRALDAGVVGSTVEANVASHLGLGFPSWTGGAVEYLEAHPDGPATVLSRTATLADELGPRFAAPPTLADRLGSAGGR